MEIKLDKKSNQKYYKNNRNITRLIIQKILDPNKNKINR